MALINRIEQKPCSLKLWKKHPVLQTCVWRRAYVLWKTDGLSQPLFSSTVYTLPPGFGGG